MTKTYARVLTIAGSDSGGGAGIQADLKAMSACDGYGMSAITALTAQNTIGVRSIHSVPIQMIEDQVNAVIEDIGVDAVKTGMLHSSEIINTVAKLVKKFDLKHLIVDPVMVATSGDKLLQDKALDTLKKELIPLAELITPNLPEAEILLEDSISDSSSIENAAATLAQKYGVSVLLKGGHLEENEVIDVFYDVKKKTSSVFSASKIDSKNTHGTGCTLSSAIATFRARGFTLEDSVKNGIDYIRKAIAAGAEYELGNGSGPVKHFYQIWND
ncbi:MAG: bifunctional hydroxymethylpyrimidine kinase/phosphomethylpyrimidine kinase [Thalassobius sp.]|nr:bifunctional hydroxymethylpyrimidine kinase/phosphomethylpyrimidine kinase [Thalassovita sp.]